MNYEVIHRELASLIICFTIHRERASRPRTKQFMLPCYCKKVDVKKVPGAGIE